MQKIKEFQGEFRWLSNFAPVSIVLDGIEYPSVEHAYMSAKSDDPNWKRACSDKRNTPGQIKRMSRNQRLVDQWERIKIHIMRDCLTQKFNQSPYMEKLLSTGDIVLEEGNTWGDEYWGINLKTGKGKNNLGKLIMQIREEII
jgi:ribA/ribD-fused uncharacterized protein